MSAALFYEAKVSEAISLVLARGKTEPDPEKAVSQQERLLIDNAATYIQDHFCTEI